MLTPLAHPVPVPGYRHAVEEVAVVWHPTDKIAPVPATVVVWPNERHPGEYTVHVSPDGWANLWYSGRDSLGPFGRWSSWPSDAASFHSAADALAAALATPQIEASDG